MELYHTWEWPTAQPIGPMWQPTKHGSFRQNTRIREEFRADVHLVAQTALGAEYRLFMRYAVQGVPYRRLATGKNVKAVFHRIYRMEETCGRAFAKAGLAPAEQYFGRNNPEQPLTLTGEQPWNRLPFSAYRRPGAKR